MNNETAETLIAYCRENQRACPQPSLWNELWKMLPERHQCGASWEPSLPLILGVWHFTSNLEKMARLAEHIEWAAQHTALEKVSVFLHQLEETDWHHIGE